MPFRKKKSNGWILTEVIVSIGIIGMLMGGLFLSLNSFRKINQLQWHRQRCINAAQALIESMAATGESISDSDRQRLWPGIDITMVETPGSGDWEGLVLVTVTAQSDCSGREISMSLSRYLPIIKEK
ncbi:MAG: type II secretion system protein [Sedimentisphaerales bacterium]|nr:type II secretion system protein [Sedimentisphaerales bacterium]